MLLLPHGYEGPGARALERPARALPAAAAEDNIQVCNPTTPAQYFHLLRRQSADFRKPLVVMTPKSLLRHKAGGLAGRRVHRDGFREVLDDAAADPSRVRRVLLCSGKVYYDLLEQRARGRRGRVAIVRLEQLYPFPEEQLRAVLAATARGGVGLGAGGVAEHGRLVA